LSKPSHTEVRSFVAIAAVPINQMRRLFAKDDSINVSAPSQPISPNAIICGAQIRAARILLGWSQAQLSRRCDVSESSILRIEGQLLEARESTRKKIAVALADAGIDFIDSVGVTLRSFKPVET